MGKPALVRSASPVTDNNTIEYDYRSLDDAFPKIDPGIKPFGTVALFQIRRAKGVTKGGILLIEAAQSTEYYNTQIAKCISIGALCFKISRSVEDQVTGDLSEQLFDYAEGPWFKPGDFVRVPKYGGDRFAVPHRFKIDVGGESETCHEDIIFALFKASNVLGLVTGDPLSFKSFYE